MTTKKLATLFTSFVLSLSVFAAVPPVTFYTDVDNPIAWEVTTYAGNTPTITVGIQTNGGAYTGLGAGWSAYLNYGKNNYASALKTITGTVAAATGIVTFNCLTNSFPASGDYFAEVYLQNTDASKITTGQGVIRVKKSPSAGSYGDLNLSPRINWDILVNLGTVPWSDFSTNFLQSQISANLTSANATSVVFQALHDAQAATNALKVDIATFNATNALKVDIATFNATNALKVDVTTFNATNALKVDMADYIIVTNLFTTGKVDLVTFNATNTLKVDTAVFNATNALKVDLVTFNATNALKVDVATFNATNVLKTDLSIYSVATNLLSTGKVDLVTFKATNVVLQSEIDDKYPSSNPSNFLTTTDNRFDHLYVADLSVLGANIGTNNLAQGVYTGVVNSTIAYTGSVGVVAGRTYAYGYSKIYSSGTSTLSIAGNSIVLTAAESDSNFFTYHLGEGSNLVITLVGTPSALCSASNIYVCQSTNGDASAARDFNVGRRLIVDGAIFTGTDTNAVWGNITGTLANQLDLTNTVAKAASALQASDLSDLEAATNALNIATNALNTATNALNTLKLDASETNGWEIGSHAGLATGTPLYVESDPNYAVQSNAILTHTESAHEVTAEGGFQAGTGAAVGLGGAGGAIGITAGVIGGGAVGDSAYAWDGGAVGKNAYTLGGGAIGDSAKTGYGFAGGRSAFATSNGLYSGEGIDAIQLGGGGNTNAGTLGVYDFQLQDAGGNVPLARMTNALVSVYTASIFPVLRLDLGGQWTDFELKATTNNFTSLCYYYISSEDNAVADDTNVWVYFTDDYHADPRQWIRQIIGLDRSIYDQLENPYSVVKSVYVYPSHNCAEDWEEWMSKSNTNLVWSYVRFDGVDYEKNYDDTGARWTTVQPSEWIAERVYVAETSGVTNSVLTNKVDVLQAPYMGELGGTNGVYWTVGSDKYWILFE